MITSLLRRVLWWTAVLFGFSEEEPDSGQVEEQTLAQPLTEASSSGRWQVFVSFRGLDTRNNFMSHLVAALRRISINAYTDDPNLRKGDEISQALKEAIQGSRIALVILSQNYASSPWCLNELLWILECKQRNNQIVVPIFYQVEPSDVRYQIESFADAFSEHSRSRSAHEVQSWRNALTQVSNISGHHLAVHQRSGRSEHEFVENIAKDISTRLTFGRSNFQDLVGINSRIEQVSSLLHFESDEVVKVGIWGMGGIGKTTIAEALFNQISADFKRFCFLSNVREESDKYGNISLRNKLLRQILGDETIDVSTILLPGIIQDRLQSTKVLLVLDDVNDSEQLDILLSMCCFGRGSRIIVTSRDRQVLQQAVDEIYEVQGLIKGEDLQLFNSFAFKARYPEDEFEELSHRLVECAKGVPLALKVLGSALHEKSCKEWESFLEKLKGSPNPTIQKILRISYDDLDDTQKDLFLDIACFFRGKKKDYVSNMYGTSACYDIGVLIDKSLIVVVEWLPQGKFVEMHDLLQEMGCDIVRQESVREPGKRSRLWNHDDLFHVLKNNTGTEAVQGMELDMCKIRELHITSTAFQRMNNLRIFNFYFSSMNEKPWDYFFFDYDESSLFGDPSDQKLYVTGDTLCSLSDKLNYLRWDRCPLKSLPLKFCAENLIELIMPYSKLEKLWDGEQNLANLKRINLRGSENLLEIPNLSQAKYLEEIDLSYCTSLCDLPNCIGLTSLETLNLKGCSKIIKFPQISESIKKLYMSGTGIQDVPASVGGFTRLKYLDLQQCQMLQIIPVSIFQLESLEVTEIRLSSFSNLERSVELLRSVKCLKMKEKFQYKLSTKKIKFVIDFNYRNSAEMEWFVNCMSCMTSLKELHCFIKPPGVLLHNLQNLLSLESVTFCGSKLCEFPRFLTFILSLTYLNLSENHFERLPESIKELSALEKLDLTDCRRLKSLPELPIGLKYLIADGCESLASVSTPFSVGASMRIITITGCPNLDTSTLENEAHRISLHRAQEDVKLFTKGCVNNPPLIITYPGREVPKWFSYQSMGSDITIKLPPGCLENKFLGIAFVAIWGAIRCLNLGVKCLFKSERGVSHQFDVALVTSDETSIGFNIFDNVVIVYSCRSYCELLEFGESHFNEASFSFSTGKDCGIVKCGICLLYTKDAENDAEPHHAQKRIKLS